MDIIERHFAAENDHDVARTLATYVDDVIWDDVANPMCPVQGKEATSVMYQGVLSSIPDIHLQPLARFSCGDHVVDESQLTGHVEGSFLGIDGGGASVSFRILHIFDLRDGLISREQVWFDSADVKRQISAQRRPEEAASVAAPGAASSGEE
jgi:steroid delta-isomerase-like uncharacterized protein